MVGVVRCLCGGCCLLLFIIYLFECVPYFLIFKSSSLLLLLLLAKTNLYNTGGTNHHIGNKRYRKMVEDRKIDYVNCKRLDKPLVALGIIREWRGQTPTGRFLKMDEKTGLWNDVGDRKAREKTSQALREKAPQIREELEKDRIARERRERGESTEDEDEEEGDEVSVCVCVCRFHSTL
jgi:hypothetical protein